VERFPVTRDSETGIEFNLFEASKSCETVISK
jgi:hypothetical protein